MFVYRPTSLVVIALFVGTVVTMPIRKEGPVAFDGPPAHSSSPDVNTPPLHLALAEGRGLDIYPSSILFRRTPPKGPATPKGPAASSRPVTPSREELQAAHLLASQYYNTLTGAAIHVASLPSTRHSPEAQAWATKYYKDSVENSQLHRDVHEDLKKEPIENPQRVLDLAAKGIGRALMTIQEAKGHIPPAPQRPRR